MKDTPSAEETASDQSKTDLIKELGRRKSRLPQAEISSDDRVDSNSSEGEERIAINQSVYDLLESYELDVDTLLKMSGVTSEDQSQANIDTLKETAIESRQEEIGGLKVNLVIPEGTKVDTEIIEQYNDLLTRAETNDPDEYRTLQEQGLSIILLPENTALNRPFAHGSKNAIFIPLPRPEVGNERLFANNAHEFSHQVLYKTDGGGRSKSKAIAEGSSIYLTQETYHTKDDTTLRSRDISTEDALFFDGHRLLKQVLKRSNSFLI